MRRIGIELKLVIFILFLLTTAMSAVVFTSRRRSEILIAEQMTESNRLVLSSLQWAIPRLMDEEGVDVIQRLFENIASSQAVLELKLYSPGCIIIASGNPLEVGDEEKNSLVGEIITEKKIFTKEASGTEINTFALPVHGKTYDSRGNTDVSAVLFISANGEYFAEAFIPFQTSVIQVSIFIAVMLTIVTTVFIRITIKNPLQKLMDAVEQVDRENYHPVIDIENPWEFRRFGEMFLRMLGEIENKNNELAEYSETLEDMVEKRTRELDHSLEQLKKAQKTIIQQEKMASIGELAAGVAHEINNPTGFVIGNLSILKEYLDTFTEYYRAADRLKRATLDSDDESIKNSINRIDELNEEEDLDLIFDDIVPLMEELNRGTNRIKEIVRGLRDFARPDNDVFHNADINEGIEEAIKIAWNKLKYKARLVRDYGKLPQVYCNIRRLEQVFINLLSNAADAIEENGVITVRTDTDGDDVIIEVEDTGKGIPETNLKSIFDPFFTTKEVGKGTGLGLSISHGIIENHNGEFSVSSVQGEGSIFRIRLPNTKGESGE